MVGRLAFQVDEQGLDQFNKGLEGAKKNSDTMGTRASALGVTLGNLATQAVNAAIDIGKLAYQTGKALAQDVAESSVEIDRLSKRLGITRREVQELGGVASGTPKALEKLQEGLGELALRGSGPAKESLGALGLELTDLEGKGPADQLRILADAMRDLPSDAERTKVALELLGEEGAALLPDLAKGSEGVDAMIQRTRDLGVILDDQAIDAGKDYARSMKELDAVWAQAAATAGTALVPVLTDLTRGAADWLAANDDVIAQRLPEVIDGIVEAGTELIEWGQELAGGIENLTGLFTRMGDEGEDGVGGLIELGKTAVEWSKAGIEIFVEWTDDVAEMADLVWDVADAIKDGLGTAYEYVEPVIGTVTEAFADQESTLGRVVDFVEGLVDRVLYLKDQVSDIVDDVGLGKAFSAEDRTAIREARDAASSPARAARYQAEQRLGIEQREAAKRRDLAEDDRRDKETVERRKRAEAKRRKNLAGSGGKGAVDTREADRLLGDEVRTMARAVGASPKAIRAALEAAAGDLSGGADVSVARASAMGALGQKTGLDLSGAGGPDAALFRQLTQIGGAEAARSATDGAKFVNIDQSVNINVGGISLEIPESYAAALTSPQMGQEMEQYLQRALSDRVFGPIVDAQAARGARP
jgi:hypothetical protein